MESLPALHSNHTQSKAMLNMSAHQLPQYYQPLLELLRSCYIRTANLYLLKFCTTLTDINGSNRSLCNMITEWFFYINHFSLYTFIIRFGWALNYSAPSTGAHTEYSSRSLEEDMTITNVIIKTPDNKWDWGVNDVLPKSDGLRIWWFWKKR